MSDPRTTPANDQVAHVSVAEDFPDLMPVEGERRGVAVPLADLRRRPEGPRDRQAAMGEAFLALEDRDGWTFGTLVRDGYAGWIQTVKLGPRAEANYMVAVRGTHLYPAPDIKREPLAAITFGARFRIVSETDRFMETAAGAFLPKPHLRPIERPFRDPVTVAQLFFGTPYLWGGNSGTGIDCSGLVQAALLAAGVPCPGDSDLQEAALGDRAGAGHRAGAGRSLLLEGSRGDGRGRRDAHPRERAPHGCDLRAHRRRHRAYRGAGRRGRHLAAAVSGLRVIVKVGVEDAAAVAFRVFELARLERPEEGREADAAERERHRDEPDEHLHQRTRSALSDTVIDESDIAAAAASGVAKPRSAMGTATTL